MSLSDLYLRRFMPYEPYHQPSPPNDVGLPRLPRLRAAIARVEQPTSVIWGPVLRGSTWPQPPRDHWLNNPDASWNRRQRRSQFPAGLSNASSHGVTATSSVTEIEFQASSCIPSPFFDRDEADALQVIEVGNRHSADDHARHRLLDNWMRSTPPPTTRILDREALNRSQSGRFTATPPQHSLSRVSLSARIAESEPSRKSAQPMKKKRKVRICKHEGCTKHVVDHGLCIAHGGGKRCTVDGCNCRAQQRGVCWKHGGFSICSVEGCSKRAKSRGVCWAHGGGTRCKVEGCVKNAVSLRLCWAHGGGKRCQLKGCRKPASERTDNLCNDHYTDRVLSMATPCVAQGVEHLN